MIAACIALGASVVGIVPVVAPLLKKSSNTSTGLSKKPSKLLLEQFSKKTSQTEPRPHLAFSKRCIDSIDGLFKPTYQRAIGPESVALGFLKNPIRST